MGERKDVNPKEEKWVRKTLKDLYKDPKMRQAMDLKAYARELRQAVSS